MTLAAAYQVGQVPIVLSDVLLSSISSSLQHHPISTRVDLNTPLPQDWLVRVSGLARKSIVICPNVAVAISGNAIGAKTVCSTLMQIFQNQTPDAEIFASTLASLDFATSIATRCTLVGWLVEAGAGRSFQWDSATPTHIAWDEDFIVGTGADLFRQIAWHPAQRTWHNVDGFDHAQHYALTQISSLLVNEITNGAPIQNLFGGGYDLLLWDGLKFRQGANVTFLFLAMDFLQSMADYTKGLAPVLIRQAEIEDCLVVRSMICPNTVGAIADEGERSAVIAPVTALGTRHRFSQPRDWSDIPHFAERVFLVVTGEGPNGASEHWSGGFSGDDAALFKLVPNVATGKVQFWLPKEPMERALIAAKNQFSRRR